jgi:hypothetical protein
MIYLPRNKNKYHKKFLFFVVLFLSILIFDLTGILKKSLEVLSIITWRSADSFESFTVHFLELFKNKQTLISENDMIRQELAELKFQLKNNDLMLQSKMCFIDNETNAEVVSKFPFNSFNTILLKPDNALLKEAKATLNGIVAKDGHVVGVVSSVSFNILYAHTFGYPREEYKLYLGDKMLPVASVGEGDGTFSFKLPKSFEISPGEKLYIFAYKLKENKVVDSKKFLAGEVVSIVSEGSDPIQKVIGRSILNYTEISRVIVYPEYVINQNYDNR